MGYLYCIDIVYEKKIQYVNSVSMLHLHPRDTSLKLNLPFDMCRWLVVGEDVEVVQQAFVEAVGVAATAFAQASAVRG